MKQVIVALSIVSAISFSIASHAASTFEERCLEEHGKYKSGEDWESCTFIKEQAVGGPHVFVPKAAEFCKEFSGEVVVNSKRNWCIIRNS